MRITWKIGLAAAIACLSASDSQAQVGGVRSPTRQPTTSPYLNLLRGNGGGGLGFNYYQRVLPQQDYLQTSQRLSQSLNRVSQRQATLQRELNTGLGVTGHQTSFFDYRGYYRQRNH